MIATLNHEMRERTLRRRRLTLVGRSGVVALAVCAGTLGLSGVARASTPTLSIRSYLGPAANGIAMHGVALPGAAVPRLGVGHVATSNYGFLSIFQEYSPSPLDISIGDSAPVSLSEGTFNYGLIPAGSYSITATSGSTVAASGTVAIAAGENVTALIYRAVGGAPTVTAFQNDKSAPPLGQSRIVFRNTANVGPVDVYLNGVKVATALANMPSDPADITRLVNAGKVSVVITATGHPIGDYLFKEQGFLVAGDLLNVFVVGDSTLDPSTLGLLTNANPLGTGYRLYASDGGVFDYGNAGFFGSTGSLALNKPIVGAASTSIGQGYWLVASDGGVFAFGNAGFFGSTGGIHLNQPIVGMASLPSDGGYWLVARDGGVFTFGTAKFYGSTGSLQLKDPIEGMASTPDGKGYWLVASDGGVFAFGDATFFGSTGSITLNKPIVAMVPTVDGQGYWLVASDGGVFTFGDASFYGSTGSLALNKPIVAAISTPDSLGYWLVASDGGIFTFGDAAFYGSAGSIKLNKPIVWGTAPGAPLPT